MPVRNAGEGNMPEGVAVARRRLLADEPSPPSVYLKVGEMPWEETKFPGIRMKVLYAEPDSGMSTILFKLEPGAEIPLHEHRAVEQTYVLEGRFVDDEGEALPGEFVWRPAGNTHVARAPEGALLLGIFLKPNHFAGGERFFTEDERA